jgi:myo-inositol 2-dehydrogenase/D-chiro-inositol 1-dehydrogenase
MNVQLAVVGLGRIGVMHARNTKQAAQETGATLAAVVDTDFHKAQRIAAELGARAFASVADLCDAGIVNASVVCTPTATHQADAMRLIQSGQRVLLEKPMTDQLATDREMASLLESQYPHALMLAFQRRFDAPLQYTKELMQSGAVGRVFKIVSALEDSGPAPQGYKSGGILKDMSVHNVDEVLWLAGRLPDAAACGGSILYSRKLVESEDEYDDGFLLLWFGDDLLAQIQVSRNHVSGYRIETWIFGENGQIHMGRFEGDPHRVWVEAYGKRGSKEPIARRSFDMPVFDNVPEFIDRFGPAYLEEVRTFIRCCQDDAPFPVTHRDGIRAMEVIEAAQQSRWTRAMATPIHWR